MTDTCDKCGAEIRVGDFPFCDGVGGHGRSVSAVHQDSVEGGFWAENGFDRPTYFESRKAHRDALAARGLEIRAKWAGPNDRHMTRWDAPCAQTLANAKALLSRGKVTIEQAPDPREEFPITVTEMAETFKYRMEP